MRVKKEIRVNGEGMLQYREANLGRDTEEARIRLRIRIRYGRVRRSHVRESADERDEVVAEVEVKSK